jgi:hypothetical protein
MRFRWTPAAVMTAAALITSLLSGSSASGRIASPSVQPGPTDSLALIQTRDRLQARVRELEADSVARRPFADSLRIVEADLARLRAPRAATSLTGVVLTADRAPVAGARVTARSVDERVPPVTRTATTDSSGRYTFTDLPTASYRITVDYPEIRSVSDERLVDGADTAELRLPIDSEGRRGVTREVVLTIVCLLLYWLIIVIARWNNIAKSLNAMIRRQLDALKLRLRTEVEDYSSDRIDALTKTVQGLCDPEPTTGNWNRLASRPWSRLWEILFWSRGEENARWVAIHEVERQLIAFLTPAEQVEPYLRWARAELRRMDQPVAMAVAEAIDLELGVPLELDAAKRAQSQSARKALLGRAVSIIYSERDAGFAALMEWQNKASWLILVALLIIGFLTVAAGHAVLFLAGGAGGFLSRVGRALRREQSPLDYGASWTTLFLSPLFGAIAGWFGIALITLAGRPEINLLGSAFALIRWSDPYAPWTLAIAFLLGFSERFFDAIVGAVERSTEPKGSTAAAPDPGTMATVAARAVERAGGMGRAAGRNGTAPDTGPVIERVEWSLRGAGSDSDQLRIIGRGFDPRASVTVNGDARTLDVRSSTLALLRLTDTDIAMEDMGADFEIVIVNPNDIKSAAFDALAGSRV